MEDIPRGFIGTGGMNQAEQTSNCEIRPGPCAPAANYRMHVHRQEGSG